MDNIFNLPPPEQAERVRALFEYLDGQQMSLVQYHKMLVPPWSDNSLIDRFRKTPERIRGFKMIRAALLEKSVLDVCKLLLDGDDTNPSLLLLVRPFLPKNRKKHLNLLKILRNDYVKRFPHNIISDEDRQNKPDWLIKQLEAENKEDIKIRLREFRASTKAVAEDWPTLCKASNKIQSVRNQWIAHFELKYNEDTKKYEPADKTPLRTVYQTIEEVVPIITENVSHLAGLFESIDPGTDRSTELAERDAKEFWEI